MTTIPTDEIFKHPVLKFVAPQNHSSEYTDMSIDSDPLHMSITLVRFYANTSKMAYAILGDLEKVLHYSSSDTFLSKEPYLVSGYETTDIRTDTKRKYEEKINEYVGILEKFRASKESLDEALEEFNELDSYAEEEGLSPTSPVAKETAHNILRRLTSELPRYYAVSWWEDGGVEIHSGNKDGRVSIFCDADGGASVYYNAPGGHKGKFHRESAREIPVELIIEALKKIPA